MKLARKVGATSEIWQIFIRDSSSTTGAGLTGLTNASSGLTAYYHRDTDTTATAISLVTMTVGTFTSSGFKEIDATNMPGWYQFCPPNAALATGAKSCAFHLKGATNMAPLPIEVDLDAQVDVTNVADGAINRATFAADTGLQPARSNTAQAGAASTITLDASASATDDIYRRHLIYLTGGTGAGQSRVCVGYVGSTKVATVSPAWTTTPDNTTTFAVLAIGSVNIEAVAGGYTGITGFERALRGIVVGTVGSSSSTTSIITSAVGVNAGATDCWKGRIVVFALDTTTAALRGQATDITANTSGATPTLTVTALTDAPASGDTFTIQ